MISIALTTYNSESTIKHVLDGILRQSYPLNRVELIIVDGGSKDSTLDIINRFVERHKDKFYDVKILVHDRNYGVSKARNDSIKLSKGKYILILDHDVILDENTLETLYKYLEAQPPKVAGVVPLHINKPSTRVRRWEETLLRGRIAKTFGATSCFLMRREIIDYVGLYDESLGPPYTIYEDIEYGARIFAKGFEIHLLGTHEVLHCGGSEGTATEDLNSKSNDSAAFLKIGLRALISLLNPRYRYAIRRFVKSLPLQKKLEWYLYSLIIPSILLTPLVLILWSPLYLVIPLGLLLALYIQVLRYYWNPKYLHISIVYSAIALAWRILRATTLLIPVEKK